MGISDCTGKFDDFLHMLVEMFPDTTSLGIIEKYS